MTFKAWARTRPAPYFVGHRGAGAVIPEHSLPGYVQAVEWSPAIEVSVVRSADGELFCMHDLTMDRTTTMAGKVADLTSAQIDSARIRVPRLGPRWSGEGMPPVPRLEAVLEAVAGRAVLCIEAKDGKAFEPMMEMLEAHKLLDAVMVKATIGSSSLDQGRKRGLPLFGYLGSGEDLTQDNFDKARLQLTGENDALILPNRVSGALLEDDLLARARQACPTVWAYSTHRRSEVAYYYSRGVSGFVSTCSGYTGGVVKPLTAPDWSQGIEPGLLTLDPYSDTYAIDWSEGAGSITIGGLGKPAFVTLGDLGEMSYSTWELHVKAQVAAPRTSDDAAAMVVVCTQDDANPAVGFGSGYRAVWSLRGELRIEENAPAGAAVLALAPGDPPKPGSWVDLVVRVSADKITLEVDSAVVVARDLRWRGGYVHVGCGARAGKVSFSDVSVA